MKALYNVKELDGRLFIVEWPYSGPDAIIIPIVNGFNKPCKLVGIAKPGTAEGIYHEDQLKDIEDDY